MSGWIGVAFTSWFNLASVTDLKVIPDFIHPPFNRITHTNRSPPLTRGFSCPLISGIKTDLFMYTKFVIVVDDDINVRNWKDVIWAMTTRMDPKRDSVFVENTPIDCLDFASPVAGLGSKVTHNISNVDLTRSPSCG
jgi:hypothetical protein